MEIIHTKTRIFLDTSKYRELHCNCRFLATLLAAILVLSAASGLCSTTEVKPIWLAVAEADLLPALKPLAEKRRSDGFEVVVSSETIETALAALPRRPRFLLLVGDDELGKAHRLPAKHKKLYRWRSAQPKARMAVPGSTITLPTKRIQMTIIG